MPCFWDHGWDELYVYMIVVRSQEFCGPPPHPSSSTPPLRALAVSVACSGPLAGSRGPKGSRRLCSGFVGTFKHLGKLP